MYIYSKLLHIILTNFFQSDVNDCHFAINHTLNVHPELDSKRIGLIGAGYGATIAIHLSLKHEEYKQNLLVNPITDIGAMSSSTDLAEWPYHILGINYTSASVPTDILTSSWNL